MSETRLDWIRSNVEPPILDVGCGHSIYFWFDSEDGAYHIEEEVEYLGVDKYEDPIDTGYDTPENFMVAPAEDLPLDDDSYKTVLLGEILEHADNPIQVIQEAKRVSNSKILITVTHEEAWLPGVDFSDFEEPRREYDSETLLEHCQKAGLSRDNVEIGYTRDIPLAFWLAAVNISG